jgi:hypothetical protein
VADTDARNTDLGRQPESRQSITIPPHQHTPQLPSRVNEEQLRTVGAGVGEKWWGSQDLVETLAARFVGRFELLRTEPSEVAVTSRSVVEGIEVVGHIGDRKLSVLVDLLLDSFFLQAAEEGLGDGVVPAVALPAHTRFEVIRTAEPTPRVAAVLGALI